MGKASKIIIITATVITILFLGWWYIHITWIRIIDCFPVMGRNIFSEIRTVDDIMQLIFQPRTVCGSF